MYALVEILAHASVGNRRRHLAANAKKRKLGLVHDSYGHRVEWEDALATVFGNDWPCKRDQYTKA
eukprot:6239752-Pyramimonas_sp.AAC.1